MVTKQSKKPAREEDEDLDDVFNTETPTDVKKRNEEIQKSIGKGLSYFSLKDEETAVIRFLDDRPLTFYQHRVWDSSLKNGQGGYRNLTCSRKNCPLCKAGNRPRYVGAYRIIHIDAEDKNGKIAPREKIFLKGVNTLSVLEKKNQKKALSSENMEVERMGGGFDTQYLFDWTGENKKPKDYIRPEDGDDLQEIFKIQPDLAERLALSVKKGKGYHDDVPDEDEEEDTPPPKKSAKSKSKGKKSSSDDDDIKF
jgi:hypothetical protein